MATLAQTNPRSPGFREFAEYLKQELAPYPGADRDRKSHGDRGNSHRDHLPDIPHPIRIPGCSDAIVISRENLRATVTSAVTVLVSACIGTLYVLIAAGFVVNDPMLHFLWNAGSLFVAFFLLNTLTSYLAALLFAVMLAVSIPLWDAHVSAETNVENVLWVVLALFVGVAVTAATEFAFVRTKPGQQFGVALADRLSAVHSLLVSYAEDGFVNESAEARVVRFGFLGTSTWRTALYRSGYDRHYRAQIGALFSLVRRLVDMAGALAQLRVTPTESDRAHLRDLASAINAIRGDLLNRRVPRPVLFHPRSLHTVSHCSPKWKVLWLSSLRRLPDRSTNSFHRRSRPARPCLSPMHSSMPTT